MSAADGMSGPTRFPQPLQGLLNSLFSVLHISPSRHLFDVGLELPRLLTPPRLPTAQYHINTHIFAFSEHMLHHPKEPKTNVLSANHYRNYFRLQAARYMFNLM